MQSRKTFLSLALTVIVLISWDVAAQGPGNRGGQGRRPPTPAIDTALDTNGDEVISVDEILEASTALIELDIDADGQLSFTECLGFSPEGGNGQTPPSGNRGGSGRPPAPPIFTALDTSADQILDEGEIADAPASLLMLDEDEDGQLQPEEYRPPHHGHGKGGGRGR